MFVWSIPIHRQGHGVARAGRLTGVANSSLALKLRAAERRRLAERAEKIIDDVARLGNREIPMGDDGALAEGVDSPLGGEGGEGAKRWKDIAS